MTSRVQFPRECQLVVFGVGGVGKSALKLQFVQNHFMTTEYDPTVDEAYIKQCIIDDEVVRLNVNEEYGNMYRERLMRMGEGFLIVYSITSRASFGEISSFHQQILRVRDQAAFPVIVVANKCDLERERQGRKLAKRLGCIFIEASAKEHTNVDEVFTNLVREIRRLNKEQASERQAMASGVGSGGQDVTRRWSGCVVL
ncbi:ras-like protein [Mycena belliarum]|uniref:Ras-like protein n=1 Tax=Mycena belliarum TaxID=1033014 RepID=A0AAD6XTH0_9AGAR|nr:ras-like protein [Mycena belliae]